MLRSKPSRVLSIAAYSKLVSMIWYAYGGNAASVKSAQNSYAISRGVQRPGNISATPLHRTSERPLASFLISRWTLVLIALFAGLALLYCFRQFVGADALFDIRRNK